MVLAAEHADAVVAGAELLLATERGMQRALRAGGSVSEVLGAAYEHMLEPGRE